MSNKHSTEAAPPFDLDRCLQALGGSASQQQDPSTRAGRLMRRLLLEQQAHETNALELALMTRLRTAGAFKGGRRPAPRWWQTRLGSGLPAGLLSLAGVATLFVMLQRPDAVHEKSPLPSDDGEAVMRGAAQAQQRLQVADPQALASELEALLKQQPALKLRRTQLAHGQVQLQAQLPMPLAADDPLRTALQRLGVNVPEHGRLLLLIEASPSPAQTPNSTKPAQ